MHSLVSSKMKGNQLLFNQRCMNVLMCDGGCDDITQVIGQIGNITQCLAPDKVNKTEIC